MVRPWIPSLRVLDADGRPVPRVLLSAVRDSYFTFRGKDSTQTGDFRLHNWEEMTLNQFLYANGEVVKLYHYPRGPGFGLQCLSQLWQSTWLLRYHASNACIAGAMLYRRALRAPGTELPANGLPAFTLYFENDDESQRRWGGDSLLSFTAPHDGDYCVVLQDVRQFQGPRIRVSIKYPRATA